MPLWAPENPKAHQRAIVFVDGTNLLYRLQDAKIRLRSLAAIFTTFSEIAQGREITKLYFYTSYPTCDPLMKLHDPNAFEGIKLVLGQAVLLKDGNRKEKGVDALLVADLIYHAASRNCECAILVSTDTDFAHAIKRVDDFGCRSVVVSICADPPDRLAMNADRAVTITADQLVKVQLAT